MSLKKKQNLSRKTIFLVININVFFEMSATNLYILFKENKLKSFNFLEKCNIKSRVVSVEIIKKNSSFVVFCFVLLFLCL